jgi:hypothetical protein
MTGNIIPVIQRRSIINRTIRSAYDFFIMPSLLLTKPVQKRDFIKERLALKAKKL